MQLKIFIENGKMVIMMIRMHFFTFSVATWSYIRSKEKEDRQILWVDTLIIYYTVRNTILFGKAELK